MKSTYIPRTLAVGEKSLTEEQLLREGRIFVVLAEPGAGKTELLKRLADLLQATRIRASIFRNRRQAATGPLVIDAMDEVARIDALATDRIIDQASQTTAATVIFAGRSGEWDQGRTICVEQCFGEKPILVRLEPFNPDEQRQLFAAKFEGEDFEAFAREVHKFELGPLLGNPQFLQLLGDAYIESGRIFTSKAKIFTDAVRRLAHEANIELGQQKTRPTLEKVVALGGEVFANLMLSGASGVAVVEQLGDRDFPYLNGLCRGPQHSSFLIDTRLFKPSDDADKHEPVHRIVAEYCAATYLVKRIEDSTDRLSLRRMLAIIAPNGVVRDELRGMLGWMAALGREPLQLDVIELDPYAVLSNGDPSQLTIISKQALLKSLEALSERDPMFRRSDRWRQFNAGRFFSNSVLDQVRAILKKEGSLRDLTLELLLGTEAASSLVKELVSLVKDSSVDGRTRILALDVLLDVPTYDPSGDFADLLCEGSIEALEAASTALMARGASIIGVENATTLLSKLANLYSEQDARHLDGISHYFIHRLIQSFNLTDLTIFLDNLSADMHCTCTPKYEILCTCRQGKSKIIGKLLDRYFEIAPAEHDPARIHRWTKALHFGSGGGSGQSASIAHLQRDHELRRAILKSVLEESNGAEAASKTHDRLFRHFGHSGLFPSEDDLKFLSEYAANNKLIDVWAALLSGHSIYGARKDSNPLRTLQRMQSRTSRELLAAWSRREKFLRDHSKAARKENRFRIRNRKFKRHKQQRAVIEEQNRLNLQQNLAKIEAGQHWWWLNLFARNYLFKPDTSPVIVEDPETPLRALRNCFPFLDPHIPTIEGLTRQEGTAVARVLLAACLVRFRDGENLKDIDPRILAAVATETASYSCFAEGEQRKFESAVHAALFISPEDAETFVRRSIEPELVGGDDRPTRVSWLSYKPTFQPLQATLPLEWLQRFPRMPVFAEHELVQMAAKYGNQEELRALIDRRLDDPEADDNPTASTEKPSSERRKFWQLNAFLYDTPGSEAAWNELKDDPKTIFALEHRLGRLGRHDNEGRPPVTAQQVFKIIDAYVDVWPKVPLPSVWGTGDPEEETAYRFLSKVIWNITEDAPDRRLPVLEKILANQRYADFHEVALTLRAEALRQIALQDFRAPPPPEINKMLNSEGVASVEDLRALLVEELGEMQKWLDGSETDPLEQFYSGGRRVGENTARNRIVERLEGRMTALGLSVVIEHHMAQAKRCDITASVNVEGVRRLLVIEVKGQWNDELYTAACVQLDQRYAIHPDAAKQGIYLVLWYGSDEKVAGLVNSTIATADELKSQIISDMPEELRNRIDVVVLDLSRSSLQKG